MKRRWIILLLLFMTIGAAGYGFTKAEAQKVQKTSSLKIQAVYLECESVFANPVLEVGVLQVLQAVENPGDLYRSTGTCNILCKKRKGQDAGNLESKRE